MGDARDEQEALRRLLGDARAVLFDFDGPVTRLFRGVSTAPVAQEIKAAVREIWGPLDPDVEACEDSHGILRRIRDMYDRPAPVSRSRRALALAEAIVTRYEYQAVEAAEPTARFTDLVDELLKLKLTLAIVSNNAEGPVWEFLKRLGMESRFETVIGRDPYELRHMKPASYAVDRAVQHLGLLPSSCLLVGDQLTDLEAARAAGTRFIGYTSRQERATQMWERLADWVVPSHEPVIVAARALRKGK
ncbi:HAD family hydrolase [Streptomyces sp. NPDC052682]|uniref:HAD family hydrolase n=1 Tax=Streptomyces sp. NPDC052682 TaxID=3154954 RepID=UPI00341C3279